MPTQTPRVGAGSEHGEASRGLVTSRGAVSEEGEPIVLTTLDRARRDVAHVAFGAIGSPARFRGENNRGGGGTGEEREAAANE